jgi:hypothetical protein
VTSNVPSEKLNAENQAELRDQNADADAFRAGAHGKPDDRQEQNIKQLKLLFLGQTENQGQRQPIA